MAELRCDFYDWATRRNCAQPASWVTRQVSGGIRRGPRFYCDTHRPPRAEPLTKPSATGSDRAGRDA